MQQARRWRIVAIARTRAELVRAAGSSSSEEIALSEAADIDGEAAEPVRMSSFVFVFLHESDSTQTRLKTP